MSEELLPCPFCGVEMRHTENFGAEYFSHPHFSEDPTSDRRCILEGQNYSLHAEEGLMPELWNTRTAPKVKALEWEIDQSLGFGGEFGNGIFQYQVSPVPQPSGYYVWRWRRFNSKQWHYGGEGGHSGRTAKAAAQADYERRILSALEG